MLKDFCFYFIQTRVRVGERGGSSIHCPLVTHFSDLIFWKRSQSKLLCMPYGEEGIHMGDLSGERGRPRSRCQKVIHCAATLLCHSTIWALTPWENHSFCSNTRVSPRCRLCDVIISCDTSNVALTSVFLPLGS